MTPELILLTPLKRRDIFAWYNRAMAAARQGKSGLDKARTNRALGLLLSGKAQDRWQKYGTRFASCKCPDSQKNGGLVCKHRTSMMIAYRILMEWDAKMWGLRQMDADRPARKGHYTGMRAKAEMMGMLAKMYERWDAQRYERQNAQRAVSI